MPIHINRVVDQRLMYSKAKYASNFFQRFRGLLGRKHIGEQEALIFANCNSVHTLGMKTEIDILYLDAQSRVIKLIHKIKPNRFSGSLRAKMVVEVGPGTCKERGICLNDVLSIEDKQ